MEKEDTTLEQRYGKQNPFLTPEGYFESFGSIIMNKIPQESVQPTAKRDVELISNRKLWRTAKPNSAMFRTVPLALAAASMCAVIFGTSVFIKNYNSPIHNDATLSKAKVEHVTTNTSYSVADEVADYAMLDNEDIYAYVSEN